MGLRCEEMLVAGEVFSHLATGTVEAKLNDGVMAITRHRKSIC